MDEQTENKAKIKRLKIAIAVACAVFFVLWSTFFFAVKVYDTSESKIFTFIWDAFINFFKRNNSLKGWNFWLGFLLLFITIVYFISPLLFLFLIMFTLDDKRLLKLINLIKVVFGFNIGLLLIVSIVFIVTYNGFFTPFMIFACVHMALKLVLFMTLFLLLGRLCKQKGIAFLASHYDEEEYY